MAYNPLPPLGQAANSASLPVTLSTEQSAYLDGIEGLLTTIDADTGNLAAILTAVDGIEALIGTTNTTLTTIDGRVDGIEALLGTIDADTGNMVTSLQLLDDLVLAEDAAHQSGDKGIMFLAVRQDSQSDFGADGDYVPLSIDGNGALRVTGGGGGTEYATNAAYADGNSGHLALTIRDDALTTLTEADGDYSGLRVNSTGRLWVDPSGVTLTVASHAVTNAGTFAVQVDGAALTSLQLLDDTVFVAGTGTYTEATSKGHLLLAVRRDADTTLVNTTNEMAPLQVDANGYLKVEVFSGQTLPVSVASGGIASGAIASGAIASGAFASGSIAAGAIAAGATSIATTEDTASAAADHLVKVAQIRLDTPVSGANVSASGDYTQFIADSFGKTWTAGTYPEDLAHVAGEPINGTGVRRIDTAASSAGSSGDWATMDASAEGAIWATLTPTTTSGLTIFKSIDIDETEEEIKATAGNVYGYYFANTTASARYLKFYNATAASVTVGTTTPVITLYLPPTSAGHIGLPYPISFSTAITVAATTGVADNDTGAPGANDCLVMVYYK